MATKRPGKTTNKPKPNASPSTNGAHPPDVPVKVDATLKRRFDALSTQVRAAKSRGASAFDALWEAVGEIVEHDPPLYVVAGYGSAPEYFREELGETARNAWRFIRVAKLASPREETKYGTTKLDAALSYLEAKVGAPIAHPPLPVAFERLRIPVKSDKDGRKTVPLAEARVEDVVAATRALSKKERAPTSSAEAALREAMARHVGLRDVGVRVRNGLATFTGVPIGAIDVFAEVVARAKVAPPAKKNGAPR
jgi:hypothetical protein